jgi:RimJ/RimL family protein N-acetyltransferase
MTVAIPILETERLTLRPWRDADCDGYYDLMAAPGAVYVGGPLSREDAWRKMATFIGHWSLRGYGVWAIEEKSSGAFAGYCGPWSPLGWPEPEIAWALRPSFQGRGLVTEAALRARAYVYDTLGWATAVSVIALDNKASIRVAERLGAVLERTGENRGWKVGVYRHPSPSQLSINTDKGN